MKIHRKDIYFLRYFILKINSFEVQNGITVFSFIACRRLKFIFSLQSALRRNGNENEGNRERIISTEF